MLNSIILAFSSSIDSIGIGIAYGIKNTKISLLGNLVLFVITILISYFSIFFGNILQFIFPELLTKILGSSLLILMGFFIIVQALNEKNNSLNIFNNPISSDLDNSKVIDSTEAIFLSIALSLDCFCIGLCGSIIDINLNFFPLLVSLFQLFFLNIGTFLGNYVCKLYKFPQNLCSFFSGLLLIVFGLIKLFI